MSRTSRNTSGQPLLVQRRAARLLQEIRLILGDHFKGFDELSDDKLFAIENKLDDLDDLGFEVELEDLQRAYARGGGPAVAMIADASVYEELAGDGDRYSDGDRYGDDDPYFGNDQYGGDDHNGDGDPTGGDALVDFFEPPGSDVIARGLAAMPARQLRGVAEGFGWAVRGMKRAELAAQLDAHYRDPDSMARALASLAPAERNLVGAATWLGTNSRHRLVQGLLRLQAVLPQGWLPAGLDDRTLAQFVERGILFTVDTYSIAIAPLWAAALVPVPELTPAPPSPPSPPSAALSPAPTRPKGATSRLSQALARATTTPSRVDAQPPDLRPEPVVDPIASVIWAWHALAELGKFQGHNPFEGSVSFSGPEQWPIHERDRMTAYAGPRDKWLSIPMLGSNLASDTRRALAKSLARPAGPGPGDAAAEFYCVLLVNSPLVGVHGRSDNAYLRADPAAFAKWLGAPLAVQWKALITSWLNLHYPLWDEYNRALPRPGAWQLVRRGEAYRFQLPHYRSHVLALRDHCFRALRCLPLTQDGTAQGWVDLARFGRLVAAGVPGLFGPAPKSATWGMADAKGKLLDPDDEDGWARGVGHVWAFLFHGPLRWLGLVQTAVDAHGTPVAARLTPWGAAFVTGRPLPVGAASTGWPDPHTLAVMPGAAASALMAAAATCAEPAGIEDGRLRFRFTAPAAHACFARGRTPADIHARLATAGAQLPAALATELDRWWSRWGLVNWYDGAALLELQDELLAREVLAGTKLADHVLYRVSPTAFLIDPTAVQEVESLLERAGYTPKVLDAAGDRANARASAR